MGCKETGFLTCVSENETLVPAGLEAAEYPALIVKELVVAVHIKVDSIPLMATQEFAEVAGAGRIMSEGKFITIFASLTIV